MAGRLSLTAASNQGHNPAERGGAYHLQNELSSASSLFSSFWLDGLI
jgi:hypothetical protein